MAQRADPHQLYQRAVQTPNADIWFIGATFRKLRGRAPVSLREDFCGTAFTATTWVQGHARRSAIGVDIDADTLAWGLEHNVLPAGPSVSRRIELVQGDVLEVETRKVDVVCALNFSYAVFKTRAMLRSYLKNARAALKRDGLVVLELFGGTESFVPLIEKQKRGRFTYVWEQKSFNPINHETVCQISFRFPDRSRLEPAFQYEWRLWTVPEIRELLAEAGFRASKVYWQKLDSRGEGTSDFYATEAAENQECFVAYVVGLP